MVKVAELAPAGTVTEVLLGGIRYALLDDDDSEMTTGVLALPVKVTVPVAEALFKIEDGEMESALSSASAKTSVACRVVHQR